MADGRTYIRVHDGIDEHPKIVGLPDGAFRILIESWCYCSRNLTDGRITVAAWKRIGTAKTRRQLIEAGLAVQRDGFVEMHDYLEHQRSADEVAEYRAKKQAAGAKGNHTKHHTEKGRIDPDCVFCQASDASQSASQTRSQVRPHVRSQTARKPVASTETETELKERTDADASARPNAGLIIKGWIDRQRRRPADRVVGQVAKQIGELLDQDFTPTEIDAGLTVMDTKALNPSTLSSLVSAAANGHGKTPDPDAGLPPWERFAPATSPNGLRSWEL